MSLLRPVGDLAHRFVLVTAQIQLVLALLLALTPVSYAERAVFGLGEVNVTAFPRRVEYAWNVDFLLNSQTHVEVQEQFEYLVRKYSVVPDGESCVESDTFTFFGVHNESAEALLLAIAEIVGMCIVLLGTRVPEWVTPYDTCVLGVFVSSVVNVLRCDIYAHLRTITLPAMVFSFVVSAFWRALCARVSFHVCGFHLAFTSKKRNESFVEYESRLLDGGIRLRDDHRTVRQQKRDEGLRLAREKVKEREARVKELRALKLEYTSKTRIGLAAEVLGTSFGFTLAGGVANGVAAAIVEKVGTLLHLPRCLIAATTKAMGMANFSSAVAEVWSLVTDCVDDVKNGKSVFEAVTAPAGPSLGGLEAQLRATLHMVKSQGDSYIPALIARQREIKAVLLERERGGRPLLHLQVVALNQLLTECDEMVRRSEQNTKTRTTPVIMVSGDSASGKSQFVRTVLSLAASGLNDGTPAPFMIAVPRSGDKFDSEMTPDTRLVFFDDHLCVAGTEGVKLRGEFIAKASNMSNGSPYPTVQAELEKKGNVTVSLAGLAVVSNKLMFGAEPKEFSDTAAWINRSQFFEVGFLTEDARKRAKHGVKGATLKKEDLFNDGRYVARIEVTEVNGAWKTKIVKVYKGWQAIRNLMVEIADSIVMNAKKAPISCFLDCPGCCEAPESCVCKPRKVVLSDESEVARALLRERIGADAVDVDASKLTHTSWWKFGTTDFSVVTILAACVFLLVTMKVNSVARERAKYFTVGAVGCAWFFPVACFSLLAIVVWVDVVATTMLWRHLPQMVKPAALVATFYSFFYSWLYSALTSLFGWRVTAFLARYMAFRNSVVSEYVPRAVAVVKENAVSVSEYSMILALAVACVALLVKRVGGASLEPEQEASGDLLDAQALTSGKVTPIEVPGGVEVELVAPVCELSESKKDPQDRATSEYTVKFFRKNRDFGDNNVSLSRGSKTSVFTDVVRRASHCMAVNEAHDDVSVVCLVASNVVSAVRHGVTPDRVARCQFRNGEVPIRLPPDLPGVLEKPEKDPPEFGGEGWNMKGDSLLLRTGYVSRISMADFLISERDIYKLTGQEAVLVGVDGLITRGTFYVTQRGYCAVVDCDRASLPGESGSCCVVRYGNAGVVVGCSSWSDVEKKVVVISLVSLERVNKVRLGAPSVDDNTLEHDLTLTSVGKGAWVYFQDVKRAIVLGSCDREYSRVKVFRYPHLPEGGESMWFAGTMKGMRFAPLDAQGAPVRPNLVVGVADGRPVEYYTGTSIARDSLCERPRARGVSDALVKYAARVFWGRLGMEKDSIREVIPLEEVCFGGDRCNPVKASSSAGPGRSGKVRDYVDKERGFIDPRLRAEYEANMARLRGGNLMLMKSAALTKPERRVMSKDYARTIYCSNLDGNLALKSVFAELFYSLSGAVGRTGFCTGVNAASLAFAKHVSRHLTMKTKAADIKGLDTSEAYESFRVVVMILSDENCPMSKEMVRLMQLSIWSCMEALLFVDGVCLFGSAGLTSGLWITSLINSLLVRVMADMCVVLAKPMGDPMPTIAVDVAGDDSLISVSKQNRWFKPLHIGLAGGAMGFVVTGDDKKALGDEFDRHEDVRFLKRSLALCRSGCRAGLPKCTLPRETLCAMLTMGEGVFTWARYASTLSNAWKELLMFEPDEMVDLKDLVKRASAECEARGAKVFLMSREEFERRLLDNSFETWDSE